MALPEAVLSAKAIGNIPGWKVDVLCAPPFRSWMGVDHSLDEYVSDRFGDVVRIVPTTLARRAPLGRIPALGSRPDALRILNRRLYRAAAARLDAVDYDALITWSTWHSVHLVGRRLRLSGGPPWLAHFSDPWSGHPFVKVGPLLRRANHEMEQLVLSAADRLLYTSAEAVDLVTRIFGEELRGKSVIVPHAFDPVLYPPALDPRPDTPAVARYIGRFYGERTPDPLFAGLHRLVAGDLEITKRLRVEIVGDVGAGMLDTAAARALPAGLVSVSSPVEYVASLRLAAEADVLLVVDAPGAVSVFLPSKLVDYLGAQRPIVCISPPGAARGLVESTGGHVADPMDPSAIGAALSAALDERDFRPSTDALDVIAGYSTEAIGSRMATVLAGVSRSDH